jgi:hypothetical protein
MLPSILLCHFTNMQCCKVFVGSYHEISHIPGRGWGLKVIANDDRWVVLSLANPVVVRSAPDVPTLLHLCEHDELEDIIHLLSLDHPVLDPANVEWMLTRAAFALSPLRTLCPVQHQDSADVAESMRYVASFINLKELLPDLRDVKFSEVKTFAPERASDACYMLSALHQILAAAPAGVEDVVRDLIRGARVEQLVRAHAIDLESREVDSMRNWTMFAPLYGFAPRRGPQRAARPTLM